MRRVLPFIVALGSFALTSAPALAHADDKVGPSADAVRSAADHFKKARALYAAGSYKEAIAELELARSFDPSAKDLVYNLGVVCEKAGRIDEALTHFYEYLKMDLDGPERTRAEGIVKRLAGAKGNSGCATPVAPTNDTTAPPQLIYVPTPVEAPPRGRIDVLSVSALIVGVGGFAVGTAFGIISIGQKPTAGYVAGTGPGSTGTYADLQAQSDAAHMKAIIADVGFLVGIVATSAAIGLYFGRTRDAGAGESEPKPAPKKERDRDASLTIVPTLNGASVVLGGHF